MVLKIKKKHLEDIFQFARENHASEACGILAGRVRGSEKTIEKVYHTRNVLASPSAYQIDPAEQLKVFEETERQGLDIIGFYHSHPFEDSFWSETDEEGSKLWTGYSFLIVSLKTGNTKSYVKQEDGVTEETVVSL